MMTKIYKRTFKNIICIVLALGMILSVTSFPEKTLATDSQSVQKIANVIICVRFSDDTDDVFNKVATYNNWSLLKQMYDNTSDDTYDSSFKKYIHDISEGKIDVVNVFPQEYTDGNGDLKCDVWTLKYNRSHYMSTDAIVQEVAETLKNETIDLSSYGIDRLDNLSGNCLDNLTVIVQGKSDTKGGVLYPQKVGYGLPGSTNVKYSGSSSGSVQISNYNIIPSEYLIDTDSEYPLAIGQQGVIAHEFLHILGFGDLYRNSASGTPVGNWDIMAGSSFLPQYPLSYNRYRAGWIDMETIEASSNGTQSYTLTAVSAEVGDSGGQVVAIKTPISDTELIVLEYREKANLYDHYFDPSIPENQYAFEHSIPSSGLIMYRVNTASDYLNNSSESNDIYVYRPNVTDPEKASDTDENKNNKVKDAALTGAYGKTSYGSTDLTKSWSDNTLYYSDGTNSGIQISNVTINSTNHTATFDISFADYTSANYWNSIGGSAQSISGSDPVIYGDESTGNIYLAYPVSSGSTTGVQVKQYNATSNTFQLLGSTISNATLPSLAVSSGVLYLACFKSDTNKVTIYSYTNGSWQSVASTSTSAYTDSVKLFTDKSALYASIYETSSPKKLTVYDVKNNKIIATKTAEELSNPDVCKVGNTFYLLYDEWKNINPTQTKIDTFNTDDGSNASWKTVHTFSYTGSNDHTIKAVDGKIYALFGGAFQTSPVLATYDGAQWREYVLSNVTSCISLNLNVIEQEAYVTLFNATSDFTGRMFRLNGNSFEEIYTNISTGSSDASITNIGSKVYAAINLNGSVQVKENNLMLPNYALTLTPPSGYDKAEIYVDGVPFTATKNTNGSYTAILHHSQGQIATMYSYKSNGAPNGMYVWSLSFANGTYTATAIPDFENLIAYHGFSIRISGKTGIRMSSSIDPKVRSRLIGSGISGYRLVEYGTKSETAKYVDKVPFVILGEMTYPTGGRSYYTENGTTVDAYSVDSGTGRYKFSAVLSPLQETSYTTSYAFRAYIILEKDGVQYVIYGPIKDRSMYTVAQQIMSANAYEEGTSEYTFVQNIINVGKKAQ